MKTIYKNVDEIIQLLKKIKEEGCYNKYGINVKETLTEEDLEKLQNAGFTINIFFPNKIDGEKCLMYIFNV